MQSQAADLKRAGSCAAAVLVTSGACRVITQADSESEQSSDNVAAPA